MSLIFDHPETFNVVVTCLSVLAFKQFLGSSVWIAGVRLEGHFIAWKRARIPNPSHCCLSTFYATWMFKSILAVEWVQQNVRTSGLKTKYLRIYVHIIESFEKSQVLPKKFPACSWTFFGFMTFGDFWDSLAGAGVALDQNTCQHAAELFLDS